MAATTATDGTFTVSRATAWRAFWAALARPQVEPVPPTSTDPDAFTLHGSEHALDRWADDGGRVP